MADPKCKLAVKAMLSWDGISPEEEAFAEQLCTLMEVAETSQASFNLVRVLWESYGGVASSLLSAAGGLGTAASAALSPLLSLSPAVYASAWLAIPALMLAIAPPLPPYTAAQLSAMRPPIPGAKPELVPTGTPAPTTQSVPLPTVPNNCEESGESKSETDIGFHGSSSFYSLSILSGIKSMPSITHAADFGQGFYTTPDLGAARLFAADVVSILRNRSNIESQPAIFRVYVRNLIKMTGITVPNHEYGQRMPEHYLTQYDYLAGTISGFPQYYQIKFNERAFGNLRAVLYSVG